jgi:hypothetical protein
MAKMSVNMKFIDFPKNISWKYRGNQNPPVLKITETTAQK